MRLPWLTGVILGAFQCNCLPCERPRNGRNSTFRARNSHTWQVLSSLICSRPPDEWHANHSWLKILWAQRSALMIWWIWRSSCSIRCTCISLQTVELRNYSSNVRHFSLQHTAAHKHQTSGKKTYYFWNILRFMSGTTCAYVVHICTLPMATILRNNGNRWPSNCAGHFDCIEIAFQSLTSPNELCVINWCLF